MRLKELLRIVWLNILQNKFKVFLTSVGIIAGAATIVMVIAIGQGGKVEVAEQFKNLNAGSIDISYSMESGRSDSSDSGSSDSSGGQSSFMGGGMPSMGASGTGGFSGGGMPSMGGDSSGGKMPSMDGASRGFGGFGRGLITGGGNAGDEIMNRENIVLSTEEVDDIETFVPDIDAVTISFSTKTTVNGGNLEEETTYTIGGVKSNYASISNLTMRIADFITESNDENKEKVCILGSSVAEELFDSVVDAYDSTIYIDGRPYIINGVLSAVGTVSSGISPDESIFIPYETGIKYITGSGTSPTITVIASDTNQIEEVKSNIETVLAETYPNATFTLSDAGSKMEAANESNKTLTRLLIGVAVVVFLVGGIGIMNVLFVSVKERTKEIGILKAVGFSRKDILVEFLAEACLISILGGILGVGVSFFILPIATHFGMRVIMTATGAALAVCFAIITGTLFGFYPAWKASRLVPIEALMEE